MSPLKVKFKNSEERKEALLDRRKGFVTKKGRKKREEAQEARRKREPPPIEEEEEEEEPTPPPPRKKDSKSKSKKKRKIPKDPSSQEHRKPWLVKDFPVSVRKQFVSLARRTPLGVPGLLTEILTEFLSDDARLRRLTSKSTGT